MVQVIKLFSPTWLIVNTWLFNLRNLPVMSLQLFSLQSFRLELLRIKWLRNIMNNKFSQVPRLLLPKPWPAHSRRTARQTSTSQLFFLHFLHCLATLWCAFMSVGADNKAPGGGSRWKIGKKLSKVHRFNIKSWTQRPSVKYSAGRSCVLTAKSLFWFTVGLFDELRSAV